MPDNVTINLKVNGNDTFKKIYFNNKPVSVIKMPDSLLPGPNIPLNNVVWAEYLKMTFDNVSFGKSENHQLTFAFSKRNTDPATYAETNLHPWSGINVYNTLPHFYFSLKLTFYDQNDRLRTSLSAQNIDPSRLPTGGDPAWMFNPVGIWFNSPIDLSRIEYIKAEFLDNSCQPYSDNRVITLTHYGRPNDMHFMSQEVSFKIPSTSNWDPNAPQVYYTHNAS